VLGFWFLVSGSVSDVGVWFGELFEKRKKAHAGNRLRLLLLDMTIISHLMGSVGHAGGFICRVEAKS
jgi:hypothetical protein